MSKSQYLKDKENGKVESSRFFNKDNKVFKEGGAMSKQTKTGLYKENEVFKLYEGGNLDVLPTLPDNSVDSIVTDPPYELGFMGKSWDSSGIAYSVELWKECLRVLKHGGHLLAFSGSRTYHRMAVAIEDAGFTIRDQIMWLYGSGFPKALDIAKSIDKQKGFKGKVIGSGKSGKSSRAFQSIETTTAGEYNIHDLSDEAKKWEGWKTSLKPAHEPIVVAMKPLEKGLNYAENILKNGTGALNIDGCRIGNEGGTERPKTITPLVNDDKVFGKGLGTKESGIPVDGLGRFPANVIHDGSEEVKSHFPNTKKGGAIHKDYKINNNIYGDMSMLTSNQTDGYGDSGSAARFFYGAKAQSDDREQGLEDHSLNYGIRTNAPRDSEEEKNPLRKNIHTTVKPTDLMRYLVRMITPKGGTILDPFIGSGSTAKATLVENIINKSNYKVIGIELTPEYLPIAWDRATKGSVIYANIEKHGKPKKSKVSEKQMSLF